MRIGYVMVFVSDMDRSTAFYRDVLELPLGFASSHWTEFQTEGAVLALHLSEGAGAGAPPVGPLPPASCRPGFHVTDLQSFHERMGRHGVPCVQAPRDVHGSRVAQYVDPDGMVFSVGETSSGS